MFFLDINNDVGLAQLFRQSDILAAQLLHLNRDGIPFHFGAAALRRQALQDAGGTFTPPGNKRRRIQTLASEQSTNAAGIPRLVRFD